MKINAARCPRCEWGRPPALMPENEEAWELWGEVKTQWRATGFGILGLDYPALYLEAARLAIPLTPRTMKKIKTLEAACLRAARQRPEDGEETPDDRDHPFRRKAPGQMA